MNHKGPPQTTSSRVEALLIVVLRYHAHTLESQVIHRRYVIISISGAGVKGSGMSTSRVRLGMPRLENRFLSNAEGEPEISQLHLIFGRWRRSVSKLAANSSALARRALFLASHI